MSAMRSGPGVLEGAPEADPDLAEGPDPARRSSRAARDDLVRRLRQQRQIDAVYLLGARVVGELFDEIAGHYLDIAGDVDQRLARYAALDPVAVAVAGGDKFAPLPLHVVGDGG
jgi:hypothetical protein